METSKNTIFKLNCSQRSRSSIITACRKSLSCNANRSLYCYNFRVKRITIPTKLKQLNYDSVFSVSGGYSRNKHGHVWHDIGSAIFSAAILLTATDWMWPKSLAIRTGSNKIRNFPSRYTKPSLAMVRQLSMLIWNDP